LDIAEHILERLDGNELFKRNVTLLVQIAHFDNEFSSAHSHAEIAVVAILLTCDLFESSPLDLIPTAWLTDRAALSAEMLQIIAARHEQEGASNSDSSSPTNVDDGEAEPPGV
jgi:hypothetical protein